MGKFEDLTGQRFGRLTVIERAENQFSAGGKSTVMWRCRCDCGNPDLITVRGGHLRSGAIQSCGCLHREKSKAKCIDLTGQKFGRLTVVERDNDRIKPNGQHCIVWKCKCDCGNPNLIAVRSGNLKNGTTTSCGCIRRERASEQHKKYNTYDLSGSYGIGYTSKYETFYFDLEDKCKIDGYCWSIDKNGYVVTRGKNGKMISMHRLVMNVSDPKVQVDHIHHNTTDNRKSQLRIASKSQNMRNVDRRINNTSGVTGVGWNKTRKKWIASIGYNNQNIHLGYFINFEDAVAARKEAEEKYYGEYSYDNSQKIAALNERID